jgi:hypothetical protein
MLYIDVINSLISNFKYEDLHLEKSLRKKFNEILFKTNPFSHSYVALISPINTVLTEGANVDRLSLGFKVEANLNWTLGIPSVYIDFDLQAVRYEGVSGIKVYAYNVSPGLHAPGASSRDDSVSTASFNELKSINVIKSLIKNNEEIRNLVVSLIEQSVRSAELKDLIYSSVIKKVERSVTVVKDYTFMAEKLQEVNTEFAESLIDEYKSEIAELVESIEARLEEIEQKKEEVIKLTETIEVSKIENIEKFIGKLCSYKEEIASKNEISDKIKYVLSEVEWGELIMIEG